MMGLFLFQLETKKSTVYEKSLMMYLVKQISEIKLSFDEELNHFKLNFQHGINLVRGMNI